MKMGMMKNRNNVFSPRSLIIHAIGIGAAVWLGKAWGDNDDINDVNDL